MNQSRIELIDIVGRILAGPELWDNPRYRAAAYSNYEYMSLLADKIVTALRPEASGWTIEADEDGTVELFHESSSLPALSNVRELSEVLSFIAAQPPVNPKPIEHEFYMAGDGYRTALTCSCGELAVTFIGDVQQSDIDTKVAEHRSEVGL